MKVLVTGATGGLGELVISKLLSQNIEVIATSRNEEKAKQCDFFSKVTYVPFDINSQNNSDLYSYFNKPDALIHLAWEKLDEYKNEAHTTSILENHKQFLSNLIDNGLKDITVVGTCYEYGLQEGILKENMDSKPVLPYPQGKNLIREFLETKQKTNPFNLKWPRVFYVFGEVKGRKNLYTHLINAIKNKDESFNMSGGEQIRDFLSPDEIAERIVKIALQNKTLGVINCCSGKPVKLKDFVNDFLNKNNYKIKLNLGVYPYADYEPMETWGDTAKLDAVLNIK
ncbi:MAG: NAD(P)-dependent oxidoreductase [Bacteroidia bacterium]|nr:NAD(P)-dependent oxidoreductase [Bacteroidia bacterium]